MALIASDPQSKHAIPGGAAVRTDCFSHTSSSKALLSMPPPPLEAEFSTEGLPKAFLHSLRTLFDILDDGRRGYVHISEIEGRWQGAEACELPAGVLDGLRRVTPPHGCLTFERFVAGLRYSTLNPENGSKSHAVSHRHNLHPHTSDCSQSKVRPLGPSNGTNIHHNRASFRSRTRPTDTANCAHIAPNKFPPNKSLVHAAVPNASKPGRTCKSLERVPSDCAPHRSQSVRRGEPQPPNIWHQPNRVLSAESLRGEPPGFQRPGKQGQISGIPRSKSESTTGFTANRRHSRSREEPRRHTITNGVDYGMLKQMKELEQEKDSLLAGLEVLERAREWYQNQIHNVNERQKIVGQSHQLTEVLSESNQSRLNILLPNLQEVNSCLNELMSSSGMLFSSSSTQSSSISPNVQPATVHPQAIQRLKDQNHLLTQEVTEKSERITQLEQEKSALIKQLFEARARNIHDSSTLDSTFI